MNPFETLIPTNNVNPFQSLIKPKSVKGGFVGEVLTGNTQRFGQTIGQGLAATKNADLYAQALKAHTDITNSLSTAIRNKKDGDTSRLEQVLRTQLANAPKLEDFTGDVVNKSKGAILGEALGTAVEATGVGVLKGFKSVGLAKNLAKTAKDAEKARKAFQGLSFLKKTASIGKDTARLVGATIPFGYAYDVSAGLQGQRGEEKTGLNALKPGAGTALSAAIPAGFGALRVARAGLGSASPYVASNLSGEPLEAYRRRQTGQLEGLLRGASKEKTLDNTRKAVFKYRTGMIDEFGKSIDTITTKYGGSRIGLDDTLAKKAGEVAESFGFELPQNIKSMSGKETVDLITNLNESYIPNASTLADVKINNTVKMLRDALKKKGISAFGGEKGEFATAYQKYATKSDVYKDIAAIVGKVGKRTPLQINAARNRLYNIFSENSTGYLDAVKRFEQATGERVLDKVAASRLAGVLPKTLRGAPTGVIGTASDILALLTIPLSSPRWGSWLVKQLSGMDVSTATKLLNKVPGARKAIFDAVNNENMSLDQAIRKYARNPKIGLSIEDVSGQSSKMARNKPVNKAVPITTAQTQKTTSNIPPNNTTIPPDLQPLAQEARKYKSAEEFVESKTKTIDVSELNKVKEYSTKFDDAIDQKAGDFTKYSIGEGKNYSEVTVEKSKDGHTIRNIVLSPELQGKGLGTKIYRKINAESLAETGKPLKSSPLTRNLKNGKTLSQLSGAAKGLWESLVKKGEATKNIDGTYQFKTKSQLTDFYNKVVGK